MSDLEERAREGRIAALEDCAVSRETKDNVVSALGYSFFALSRKLKRDETSSKLFREKAAQGARRNMVLRDLAEARQKRALAKRYEEGQLRRREAILEQIEETRSSGVSSE